MIPGIRFGLTYRVVATQPGNEFHGANQLTTMFRLNNTQAKTVFSKDHDAYMVLTGNELDQYEKVEAQKPSGPNVTGSSIYNFNVYQRFPLLDKLLDSAVLVRYKRDGSFEVQQGDTSEIKKILP
jgi:hypothetical protein